MTSVGQEGDKVTDFVNIFETLKEMTKMHANRSLDTKKYPIILTNKLQSTFSYIIVNK